MGACSLRIAPGVVVVMVDLRASHAELSVCAAHDIQAEQPLKAFQSLCTCGNRKVRAVSLS